jgi:hypothetical protein
MSDRNEAQTVRRATVLQNYKCTMYHVCVCVCVYVCVCVCVCVCVTVLHTHGRNDGQ